MKVAGPAVVSTGAGAQISQVRLLETPNDPPVKLGLVHMNALIANIYLVRADSLASSFRNSI